MGRAANWWRPANPTSGMCMRSLLVEPNAASHGGTARDNAPSNPSVGLPGAPAAEIAAARDTAMNPAAPDAFAMAVIAAGEPQALPSAHRHAPGPRA